VFDTRMPRRTQGDGYSLPPHRGNRRWVRRQRFRRRRGCRRSRFGRWRL